MNQYAKDTECSHATPQDWSPQGRPRFHGGQLLTDHDLNNLVNWVQELFSMQRARDGWGVVCGLDVTVEPNKSSTLRIGSGYAVDAAGRDLRLAYAVCRGLKLEHVGSHGKDASPGNPFQFGPITITSGKIVQFDVYVKARDDRAGPVPQEQSPPGWQCHPAASREEIIVDIVPVGADGQNEVNGYKSVSHGEYKNLLDKVKNVSTVLFNPCPNDPNTEVRLDPQTCKQDALRIRGVLVDRFKTEPHLWLRTIPRLPQWLEELNGKPDDPLATPWGLASVLFWMIDSYRQSVVSCAPSACHPKVPIARVWANADGGLLNVIHINARPPWRRTFQPSERLDSELLTFLPYVGYEFARVAEFLRQHNVDLRSGDFQIPPTGHDLRQMFDEEAKQFQQGISSADPVVGQVITDISTNSERRIAAFSRHLTSLVSEDRSLKITVAKADAAKNSFTIKSASTVTPLAGPIPFGGWIKLIIEPVGINQTGVGIDLFDDVRNAVSRVDGQWSAGHVVEANLQMPYGQQLTKGPYAPNIKLFVGADHRSAMIEGTVPSIDLGAAEVPSARLLLRTPDGKEVQDGIIPIIPESTCARLQICMSNNLQWPVRGDLVTKLVGPDGKTNIEIIARASVPQQQQGVESIPATLEITSKLPDFKRDFDNSFVRVNVNNGVGSFAIRNVNDDFRRPSKGDEGNWLSCTVKHSEVKIVASITTDYKLKIVNNEDVQVSITNVFARASDEQKERKITDFTVSSKAAVETIPLFTPSIGKSVEVRFVAERGNDLAWGLLESKVVA